MSIFSLHHAAFNLNFFLLDRTQLWPSGSSTTWSVHNCAKFSQLNFLQPPILLIHLGSIPKWILHSILNFRTGRATVESHGSRPVFQMPWERGIWRRIFNPHPSPLSILSHSIPLDSSSFQSSFVPNSSSNLFSNSSINSHLNSNLPSSQMRQFPLSIHLPLL